MMRGGVKLKLDKARVLFVALKNLRGVQLGGYDTCNIGEVIYVDTSPISRLNEEEREGELAFIRVAVRKRYREDLSQRIGWIEWLAHEALESGFPANW
jgi:hypothetical protein